MNFFFSLLGCWFAGATGSWIIAKVMEMFFSVDPVWMAAGISPLACGGVILLWSKIKNKLRGGKK